MDDVEDSWHVYASRVAGMKRLIADAVEQTLEITGHYQWQPSSGSPTARAFVDPTFGDRSDGEESPFRWGYSSVQHRMAAGLDHLQALAHLIVDPTERGQLFVYSLPAVTRAVLEAAARSWWLSEVEIGPGERARRHLLERVEALEWRSGLPDEIDEGYSHTTLLQLGQTWGPRGIRIAQQGPRKLWHVDSRRPPPWTTLVGQVLAGTKAEQQELGRTLYKVYAATCHGQPLALRQFLDPAAEPDSEAGVRVAYLKLSDWQVALMTGAAVDAFTSALARLSRVHGWGARTTREKILTLGRRASVLLAESSSWTTRP